MPDNSGPAFDTTNGITRRLWLAAHAPPPPQSWLNAQLAEFEDRRRPSRRTDKPSHEELDTLWRWRWAGKMLTLANR